MKRFVTIITIFLTIIGIVTPIVWSLIEKRTSLSLNLLSATPLVGISEGVLRDDLVVTFRGNRIRRLVKYEFNLVNSGNHPIDANSVKIFPNIKIPKNIAVLQAIISHTNPSGVQAKIIQTGPPLTMAIYFDLLNQGDSIYITLYADGDLVTKFEVDGRIVGLKQIEFNDFSGPSTNQKIISGYDRFQKIGTPIFGVILTGFSILVLIIYGFPRRNRRKRLIENMEQLTSLSKPELINFVNDFLHFYPNFLKRHLLKQINNSDMEDEIVVKNLCSEISVKLLILVNLEIEILISGIIGFIIATVIGFMKLMS